MSRNVWILVGVSAIAIAAATFFMMRQPAVETEMSGDTGGSGSAVSENQAAAEPDGVAENDTPTSYSAADVAAHNSATSCWTIIDGNVYDLTAWISQHPGGPEAIKKLCGRDGTQIFLAQHGTRKQQTDVLATFKVGVLVK